MKPKTSLQRRSLVLGSLFLAVIVFLCALLWHEKKKEALIFEKQIAGVSLINTISQLRSSLYLYGLPNMPQKDIALLDSTIYQQFDQVLTQVDQAKYLLELQPDDLEKNGFGSLWPYNLKRLWEEETESKENAAHVLIKKLGALTDVIIDNASLMTLSDRNTAILLDLFLYELPEINARFVQVIDLLNKKAPIASIIPLLQAHIAIAGDDIKKVFLSPRYRSALQPAFQSWSEEIHAAIDSLQKPSAQAYPVILTANQTFATSIAEQLITNFQEQRNTALFVLKCYFAVVLLLIAGACLCAVMLATDTREE